MVVLAGCTAMPFGGPNSSTDSNGGPGSNVSTDASATTSGPIGRHNGYTADTSLAINPEDGYNESELNAAVSRAIARVETVRGVDLTDDVPVRIQSRESFQDTHQNATTTESFRRFDNAKFEALFLIGEDDDSLEVQRESRGSSVLGYYSYENQSIVIVSDSSTPTLDGEATLAHELTHALQDKRFNLSSYQKRTRDEYNAVNGLIEGEANVVQRQYMDRCGTEWDCLPSASGGDAGDGPTNWGVHLLNYFPYGEGQALVADVYEREGWDGVDRLYENPPQSAEQVINPSALETDPPTAVTIEDRPTAGWQRVTLDPDARGGDRPDYAVMGQSALTAMFAQTGFDSYNNSAVATRNDIITRANGQTRLNYNLPMTNGWDGDRLHVYEKNGQTGYVWKLVWDDQKNATQFVESYERLLSHWGGSSVAPNTWVIDDGPFADAVSIRTDGSTVVIVNGPSQADLTEIRPEVDG